MEGRGRKVKGRWKEAQRKVSADSDGRKADELMRQVEACYDRGHQCEDRLVSTMPHPSFVPFGPQLLQSPLPAQTRSIIMHGSTECNASESHTAETRKITEQRRHATTACASSATLRYA